MEFEKLQATPSSEASEYFMKISCRRKKTCSHFFSVRKHLKHQFIDEKSLNRCRKNYKSIQLYVHFPLFIQTKYALLA